jgi:hypothetical protein
LWLADGRLAAILLTSESSRTRSFEYSRREKTMAKKGKSLRKGKKLAATKTLRAYPPDPC